MASSAYQVIILQVILATVGYGIGDRYYGEATAQALAYGGMSAALIGWVSLMRAQKAQAAAKESPRRAIAIIYTSVLIRFTLAILLLVVGLGIIKLQPVPVVLAFALGQMAYGWGLWKSDKD